MELTLENLIKIIIGVLVFVVVVSGIYLFFKTYVIEFFIGGNSTSELILTLIK